MRLWGYQPNHSGFRFREQRLTFLESKRYILLENYKFSQQECKKLAN